MKSVNSFIFLVIIALGAASVRSVASDPLANIEAMIQNAVQSALANYTAPVQSLLSTFVDMHQQRKAYVAALTGQTGSFLGSLANSTKNQLGAFGTLTAGHVNTMTDHYVGASDSLDALLAGYEATFCEPAQFNATQKKLAQFTGQGVAMTFDSGSCAFDGDALLEQEIKQLKCVEPSISIAKTPATFTSKHKSAPSWTGKSCEVKKEVGESSEKVLFVFDGKEVPDVNKLVQLVQTELQSALSGLSNAAEILPKMSAGFETSPLMKMRTQVGDTMKNMLKVATSIIPKPKI